MGSTHFISYLNVMRSLGSLVMLWTILFFCTAQAQAAQVNLAWTASASADGYRLYYGQASGSYTAQVDVVGNNTTSRLVTGLQDGKRYYFAAKAYKSNKTTWSGFSNEVCGPISACSATAPPTASFTATPITGTAPLVVTFNNTSTGNITTWLWTFDDGIASTPSTTSTAKTPGKSFAVGIYDVSLTATGPGGSNTLTRTDYISVTAAPVGGGGGGSGGGGSGSTVGLVGAYNFGEASGTTVADASGQSNKGTISGATRVTTGRFGKALSFDGVNDWVTVNDAASLDLTTGMTLEAWVYPTVSMTQWATVILKEQPGGGLYELYANGDRSQPLTSVTVGGQYRVLSAGPWLLANRWTHLAATYDGTTQRLYVDGVQVAQRPQTGPIQVSNSPLRLGGNSVWGEYFKGRIDEVRIYNRALKAAEIQTDMNTPIAP